MVMLDSNFLAKSEFCVKTQGGGVITTRLNMIDIAEPEGAKAVGLKEIDFSEGTLVALFGLMTGTEQLSPYDVFPSYDKNFVDSLDRGGISEENNRFKRILNFFDFICKNPIHVNKINIRATDPAMLPTQILVETPNIFEGDAGRQIIDVSSQKTAYQYQNNIVTIENTDLFIARNSDIKFKASFYMPVEDFWEKPIYIDWFVDYYLSLEKALYQNVKIL